MTLTIKEPIESASQAKPGSPSQCSDIHRAQSNRANPRCLEIAVTVRSLPGETGAAAGSGPIREEGKTVIVFDNGAVLRLWNNLPAGQKIILSSAQGNDVVCRVVSGRNLPNVQGYIEVEFMEPFNDFWGLQSGRVGSVPPAPGPVPVMGAPHVAPVRHATGQTVPQMPQLVEQQPPQVIAPVTPVRMPSVAAPEKELARPSDGAPSFDDIAGLLRMSPPPVNRPKTSESAAPFESQKNKSEFAHGRPEPMRSTIDTPMAIADVMPVKRTSPSSQEFSPSHLHVPNLSSDLDTRGAFNSAQATSVASASQTGSRIGLMIGGAALVLVGFGVGYVFMHRDSAPLPAPAAVAAVQPVSAAPVAQGSSEPAQVSPSPAERAPVERQAVTAATTAARESETAVPSSEDVRPSATTARAGQNEQQAKQRQQLATLNLKMSSPSAPKQEATKFSAGPTPDVSNLTSASGAAPTGCPIVRGAL